MTTSKAGGEGNLFCEQIRPEQGHILRLINGSRIDLELTPTSEIINKLNRAHAAKTRGLVEALEYYKHAWKNQLENPSSGKRGCVVCIEDRGMTAHKALEAFK